MKTIVINGVNYNPRHVLYVDIDVSNVLIKFIDGTKYKLKMDSKEDAQLFKNDLMNSW